MPQAYPACMLLLLQKWVLIYLETIIIVSIIAMVKKVSVFNVHLVLSFQTKCNFCSKIHQRTTKSKTTDGNIVYGFHHGRDL